MVADLRALWVANLHALWVALEANLHALWVVLEANLHALWVALEANLHALWVVLEALCEANLYALWVVLEANLHALWVVLEANLHALWMVLDWKGKNKQIQNSQMLQDTHHRGMMHTVCSCVFLDHYHLSLKLGLFILSEDTLATSSASDILEREKRRPQHQAAHS